MKPKMERYVAVCVPGRGDDEPGAWFVFDTASQRPDRAVALAGRVAAFAEARRLNAAGATAGPTGR